MTIADTSDEAEEETEDEEWEPMIQKRASGRRKWLVAGLVLMLATTGGLLAARSHFLPTDLPVTSGTMTVNTNLPGAQVEGEDAYVWILEIPGGVERQAGDGA